jgi:hypothetical protein
MAAFLVRKKNNAELVGLFVSPSRAQLVDLVDEFCSPFICEYVLLPAGGIYASPNAPILECDDPDPDSHSDPDWFSGATISGLWLKYFYGERGDLEWRHLKPTRV